MGSGSQLMETGFGRGYRLNEARARRRPSQGLRLSGLPRLAPVLTSQVDPLQTCESPLGLPALPPNEDGLRKCRLGLSAWGLAVFPFSFSWLNHLL